ncbi:MAG: histidinol dehydrogenase [Planctomycetes bacterium]|nr:histidinol dehydrogenase [Planctomycetota bacterium]
MKICRTRDGDVLAEIERLRSKLSVFGTIASARTRVLHGFSPEQSVRRIVDDVRARGDDAVSLYTLRFDSARLTPPEFRVSESQVRGAYKQVEPAFLKAVRQAVRNLRTFQEHIRVPPPKPIRRNGATLAVRYDPIEKVGVFIPGGSAPYPSTVLMTAVPAMVAQVKRLILVTPPRRDGTVSPDRLVAAREAGVSEIYKVGGVPGIAALAFGTATIPKVDKIVGPGNLFVQLAKRMVFGQVGIDMFAGPSEVVVIADAKASPEVVAADLISQAEHDPGSAVLLTDSESLAMHVDGALEKQLDALARGNMARDALNDYGLIVVTRNLSEAADIANHLAPEHLEIIAAAAPRLLKAITNAGAIFVGPFSPVAVGDYVAGPSHVLPTGGTARFFSGLSVNDFLKRTTVISYSRTALKSAAPSIRAIAAAEGLTAHVRSVDIRLSR